MEEKNKIILPNFIVVDSTIYADKRLSNTDKVLYGLISALSTNTKRVCYASNTYLSCVMNIKAREIQYCLRRLSELKYITITIKNNNTRFLQTSVNHDIIQRNIENGVNENQISFDTWFGKNINSAIAPEEEQEKMRKMIEEVTDVEENMENN